MAFLRDLTVELTLLPGWRSSAAEPARLLLDYRAFSGESRLRASGAAAVRREASPKGAGAGVGRMPA